VPHGWPARLARLVDRAGTVDRVVVSSVAPATTAALRGLGTTWGPGVPVAFVDPATTPLVADYRPPASLGTDRIAAAVAAHAGWGAPVVVVDVGTAITCDAVDAAGRFVGGAITPGPATAYGGLSARAPHLACVPDPLGGGAAPLPPAGTSTAECLRIGVVRGSAALVDGLVRDLLQLVGPGPVVATGGLAAVIARAGEEITDVDPDLTLRGIHLAATVRSLPRQRVPPA
jgi:type III pantothenate kinase